MSAAVLIMVVAGVMLYFRSGEVPKRKFSISNLVIHHTTQFSVGILDFTLTNQGSLSIYSVGVTINGAGTMTLSTISQYNPVAKGQAYALVFYTANLQGNLEVVQGQSYAISVSVQFQDGSATSYSATIVAS